MDSWLSLLAALSVSYVLLTPPALASGGNTGQPGKGSRRACHDDILSKYDPFVSWIPRLTRRDLWSGLPLYSPDKRWVAYARVHAELSHLEVYSVATKKLAWDYINRHSTPYGTDAAIYHFSWSPDSKKLAVAEDVCASIFDAATGKREQEYNGLGYIFFDAQWSPDGKRIAFVGAKGPMQVETVQIWDPASKLVSFETSDGVGSQVRWSPDGKLLAFNGRGIQLWDTVAKKRLAMLPPEQRGNMPFSWSPDGQYLVVGDIDTVRATIYDAQSGQPVNRHKFKEVMNIDWLSKRTIREVGNDVEFWSVPVDAANGKIPHTDIKVDALGDEGYIPKDIQECMVQLDRVLSPEGIQQIKAMKEDDLAPLHHGLGMKIRNGWGFWAGSDLARYFLQHGLQQPEAMSSVILHCYWRHLHDLPIDFEREAQREKR
jgi:Tol biopolymer transport system component